jgi:hypothetical protein
LTSFRACFLAISHSQLTAIHLHWGGTKLLCFTVSFPKAQAERQRPAQILSPVFLTLLGSYPFCLPSYCQCSNCRVGLLLLVPIAAVCIGGWQGFLISFLTEKENS